MNTLKILLCLAAFSQAASLHGSHYEDIEMEDIDLNSSTPPRNSLPGNDTRGDAQPPIEDSSAPLTNGIPTQLQVIASTPGTILHTLINNRPRR